MALLAPATRKVIEEYQHSAPVDVLGLAQRLGLAVWEDDLGPDISGKIFRDEENGGSSGFSIVIGANEAPVRKRFTIAHEIAHFVLHRNHISSGLEDDALYRSKLSNGMEAEANRLAADILMPYSLLRELQSEGYTDINTLARMVQVSQHALKIRFGIPVVD